MKKGYLGIDLLILIVCFGVHSQVAMAKQHGFRRCLSPPCPPRCPADHYALRRLCLSCSRCGPGLYVAHECSAHRDTVCDSCHTYRGPHNRDFYDRCVRHPLEEEQEEEERRSPPASAKETESITAVNVATRDLPTTVIVACSVVMGALAVTLLVTCLLAANRRYCKKVDQRYHYVAVATKDAVML